MRKNKYLFYIGETKIVNRFAGYMITCFNLIFSMGMALLISNLFTMSEEVKHFFIIFFMIVIAILFSSLMFNGYEPFWAIDNEYLYYSYPSKHSFFKKIILFIKYLLFLDGHTQKIAIKEIDSIQLFYKEVPGMYRLPCYSIFFTLYLKDGSSQTLPCLNLTNQVVIADTFEYLKKLGISLEDNDHLLSIMKNTSAPVTHQVELLDKSKQK